MNVSGLVTPNYGQMGTENLPAGNRAEMPYGMGPGVNSAPTDVGHTMQGPAEAAHENVGYRPMAGRADRLSANIVGGGVDNVASGGYSRGATQRI